MSSSILIIRHVPHESAGTIETFLHQNQISFDYLNAYDNVPIPASLSQYHALIVMGGPMNVDETQKYPFLSGEIALIQNCIRDKKLVVGICLGAQLIAKALGARVYPGRRKEIGWFPVEWLPEAVQDPVLRGAAASPRMVFHWHGDTFDLPNGAACLASSAEYPNQLFRYGDSVYGFQFHIEVTADMVKAWMDENKNDFTGTESYLDRHAITDDVEQKTALLGEFAYPIYEKLFRQIKAAA